MLDIDSKETALTDIYGNPKDKIIQGVVGIMKDDTAITPNNFLYDKVIFDSPKEKENIKNSNIDEVIVLEKYLEEVYKFLYILEEQQVLTSCML